MAPIPVWSGNLRLSLVLVPVRLFPATSTEGSIAFRMIHQPSGKPIKYLKGVETEHGFWSSTSSRERFQSSMKSAMQRHHFPVRGWSGAVLRPCLHQLPALL